MTVDHEKLMEAIALLSVSKTYVATRVSLGEWDLADFMSRQDEARRIYAEFVANPSNVSTILQRNARLIDLCKTPWQAQWAKSILDDHSERILEELRNPSGKAAVILESLWSDYAMIPVMPSVDDDPEERTPF